MVITSVWLPDGARRYQYGNRNFDLANTTSNVLGANPTISQPTNRLSTGQGYGYDDAGNLTSEPATSANGIVYDAENRQTQYTKSGQQTNYYFYDGDGHRVKKIDNNGTTVFVYNAGGQLIAEYTSGPPQGSGTSYLTNDHLGSTRVVMKADGTVARHDYLPFGEEIQAGVGGRTTGLGYVADTVRQKFTQKERDNESGLDYYLARYYASPQGRFTSADPIIIASERLIDPQQLNLYPYARNNPLRFTDPTGEIINEPTGLSNEDQKKYEKWKAAYLSTEAGREMWAKYRDDQNFTLNVAVADRGTNLANKGAEVHNNVFDASGDLSKLNSASRRSNHQERGRARLRGERLLLNGWKSEPEPGRGQTPVCVECDGACIPRPHQ